VIIGIVGAGIGALLGTAAGAAFPGERWESVELQNQSEVDLPMNRQPPLALTISFSF
jgi:hypothetical protein